MYVEPFWWAARLDKATAVQPRFSVFAARTYPPVNSLLIIISAAKLQQSILSKHDADCCVASNRAGHHGGRDAHALTKEFVPPHSPLSLVPLPDMEMAIHVHVSLFVSPRTHILTLCALPCLSIVRIGADSCCMQTLRPTRCCTWDRCPSPRMRRNRHQPGERTLRPIRCSPLERSTSRHTRVRKTSGRCLRLTACCTLGPMPNLPTRSE